MKRSIMGLMYLIQGMQSAGVDVLSRLKEIGILSDQLTPTALIYRDLEWQIQQHITQGLDPFLGLKVGQHYTLAGYGPFLMFLMTAEHVEQALHQAMQYQGLTYLSGKLSYEIAKQHLILRYQPLDVQDAVSQFRMNSEISGTYRFIRDIYTMSGLPNYDIDVYLPMSQPTQTEQLLAYRNYYGENLRFGWSCAEFWIDIRILRHRLSSADAIMHEVYRQRCEDELARMNASSSNTDRLSEQIRDYLLLQREVIPNLTAISRALNIPERTIRYQLAAHQSSFQQIRQSVIKQKAEFLLKEGQYTIEEIAGSLGYAETASFNHAFKRWYGMSPKQFQAIPAHDV
ncbi:MAG: AraC family transcriptional regulator [Acinetobacter populi]|jgi:AraC-like DNA-binding protein|uniref:helix-turn-helix domain-containing protein n=1 Tax=Acinetobacter populi TaxID=1582270 RepID=UPI002357F6F7|nr:AraC family transcriptional regulator [Acinetobacter populi]MCH4247425.1 AraC family transcriptional regulator [Acinetobacter populi]